MGQRLCLEIKENDKTIMNCYYHWSAYTSSSLEIVKNYIELFDVRRAAHPELDNIVNGVFTFVDIDDQAGLSSDSLQKMQEMYPDIEWPVAQDRNCGLIGTTEVDMENTLKWAEGYASIDIATETFCFDVCWYQEPDEFIEDNYSALIDLPTLNISTSNIPFSKLEEYIAFWKRHDSFSCSENDFLICSAIE